MFKESPEGQTHSFNDGCGEPAHNDICYSCNGEVHQRENSCPQEDFLNAAYSCQHDYRFSHYEEDRNVSTTAVLNNKYAIMICRHCGNYVKQKMNEFSPQ